MKRSVWKLPFITHLVYSKNFRSRKGFLVQKRNLLVTKAFLGKRINLYNGLWSQTIVPIKAHLGHRLGEFVHTRRCDIALHIKKKDKKKKIKKKKR